MTSPAAWAQDDPPEETVPSTEGEPERESAGVMAAIDRAHGMISSRITDTVDRLDSFLGEERIQEELNRSYLNTAVLRISDEDGLEIKYEVKLKIVLPRLQNRLHLVIAREDEIGALESEEGNVGVKDVVRGSPSRDLTSALRLVLRATRDLNIYLDGGVRVRLHSTVFARLRYRKSVELEHWVVRFTQGVKWEEQFADNPYQWEVISQLAFERPIIPDYFFRVSFQGAWFEGQPGYFVTQGFSLVQQVTARRALVYEWSTSALRGRRVDTTNNTAVIVDPDTRFRIEETGFKVRYRQTIGWPWLFFEADAELAFRRGLDPDSDFDGIWRTLVKLEVQFRDMSDKKGNRPLF